MPIVADVKSACTAVRLIIEQGEGELPRPDRKHGIYDEDGELAHYYRFDQITLGQKYMPGDQPGAPTGVKFEVRDDVQYAYPVKPNIKLADFPPDSELLHAAQSFNAAYGFSSPF